MSSFGKITLAFGPTGAADEEPVSFRVRPINLLVGPNNSGKSLFLRELSGINPRSQKTRSYFWSKKQGLDVESSSIVADVSWSDEEVAADREAIIEEVLGEGHEKHGNWPTGIPVQPWEQLLPALERVASGLESRNADVLTELMELLRDAPEEIRAVAQQLEQTDADASVQLALGLGVLTLVSGKHEAQRALASAEIDGSPSPALALPQPLSLLEGVLRSYWGDCMEIIAQLGLSLPSSSFDELSDPQVIAGVLQTKLRGVPLLGELFEAIAGRELGSLPTKTVEDLERASELAGSLMEPDRLRGLARLLLGAEQGCGWSNAESRRERLDDYLFLDGLARLTMTESGRLSPYDDTHEEGPPVLALHKNPHNRELLRAMVAEVLDAHLVIDMVTDAPTVSWRLAKEPPCEGLETHYEPETRDFMVEAVPIEGRSDGIHAIVGMFAAILAKVPDVIFIDEPEAFLHPPLVHKFARVLGALARENDMQVFIATHSPELLAGFAPTARDINIVRLNYDERGSKPVATARLLHPDALRRLALDPLLRSESTLSALFAEGAVVCEAPADRTLYQEVNTRLLNYGDRGDGIESCAFLNAQNWQTVGRMIRPLREMGVAAAAILDADVLFDKDLKKVLRAAQLSEAICGGFLQARGKFKTSVQKRIGDLRGLDEDARKKLKLKHELISELDRDERDTFEHLLAELARYGLFIVPFGELECWLGPLGLKPTSSKAKWFKQALERLGWDPEVEGYATPTEGDIWGFIRSVAAWITDPCRKGTAPVN